jgi:hypothetical protein
MGETADHARASYSTAVKGVQEYNNKVLEFAQANMNAAFEFTQRLALAKTPSEFVSLSTEHALKQFEVLAEQTKYLASLAQNGTIAAAQPLRPHGPRR